MTCEILNTFNPLEDANNLSLLDALQQLDFYLERIKKNILLINAGPNAKVINESNTTLYNIAVAEYGDAKMWSFLADANGIDDPEIIMPTDIIIPPLPTSNVEFGVS